MSEEDLGKLELGLSHKKLCEDYTEQLRQESLAKIEAERIAAEEAKQNNRSYFRITRKI